MKFVLPMEDEQSIGVRVELHWEVASYYFKAYYSILGIHGMQLGEVVPLVPILIAVTICNNNKKMQG